MIVCQIYGNWSMILRQIYRWYTDDSTRNQYSNSDCTCFQDKSLKNKSYISLLDSYNWHFLAFWRGESNLWAIKSKNWIQNWVDVSISRDAGLLTCSLSLFIYNTPSFQYPTILIYMVLPPDPLFLGISMSSLKSYNKYCTLF